VQNDKSVYSKKTVNQGSNRRIGYYMLLYNIGHQSINKRSSVHGMGHNNGPKVQNTTNIFELHKLYSEMLHKTFQVQEKALEVISGIRS